MSYDIYLAYKDGLAEVPQHKEGGTYNAWGSPYAELNITYNYAQYFLVTLDGNLGIRWLYGKKAKSTIKKLQEAVEILGITPDADYWAVIPGNAGYALSILLDWAKLHPNAVWRGD